MSDISASARIDLSVNGQQPKAELESMKKQIINYREAMSEAAKAGDKVSYEKWRKELRKIEREVKNIESAAKNVESVMMRLDKASPKELRETLKTLEKQLQKIERGSKAWKEQTDKIKRVKAELEKVNREMKLSTSLWERFNLWVNNCATAVIGFAAAVGGLIAVGRSAVKTFAEMEEQMANTRKYTGLSVEEVEKLNQAFLRMNSRTGRDKLNELAQEAGRLGMNTLEAVQGYVEAADIIRVALVDLGEGATQTIAKLTNIFGVQKMMGVKDSMLAVGSTVNVLSQNCTASKPYLVEFAQRMAGIGAQAGLTIPQILAFGAVLDANGQKVEMSATAIQKVIMNLANKNKEFAAVVGLDAEKLNSTLKRSAKDGLLMFLEALNRIGKESGFENATMSLAPAFKDMGLDAARVAMVLSTLSEHIGELKWQLGEANKAFREATSATKEYEIFNNTAQATLEKAKARFRELVIELGQNLMPVMRHAMTSTSAMVRSLLLLIKWVKANTTLIMSITSAIVAYTLAVKANTIAVALNNGVQKISEIGFKVLKPAILACRLAYARLTNQTLKAAAAQRLLNQSMKVNVYAVVLAALVALAVWMKRKHDQDLQAIKDAREKAKAEEEFKKSLTNVEEEAEKNSKKELSRLEALYSAAVSEVREREERIKAVKKLQELYPEYFKSLTVEEIMAGKAAEAYDKLKVSIIEASRARAAQSKYDENMSGWIDAESELDKLQKENERLLREKFSLKKTIEENSVVGRGGQVGMNAKAMAASKRLKIVGELIVENNQLMIEQQNLMAEYEYANRELMTKYGISTVAGENGGRSEDDFTSRGYSSAESEKNEDKFKKEKEWREKEEALARIAYARGESDYIEYTDRMNEILLEFYARQLEHTDLSEAERLSITAQYLEQNKKMEEAASSVSLEVENKRYAEESAILKQHYVEGLISKETYDKRIIEIEIEHQRRMVALTEEGSKERLEAERALTELLIKEKERRKKEMEKRENEISRIKDEYFGDNIEDKRDKYDHDLKLLYEAYNREIAVVGDVASEKLRIEEAYQKALIALKKKYGLEAGDIDKNAVRSAVADSVEWLNSEGGKAVIGTMDTLVSGMASVFSQLSSIIQSELEIQTAAIAKKYDTEIAAAEGNSYRVAKLEKQKEKEIAKAKQEANRKQFNMQVIQAVAQTAQGAISAYSSAAAVPIIGWVLAPIAASLAIAAGMLQVQAIKKQQQASEVSGYSEGGFTKPGAVDEPAGIVHAGEWVASQKLVNSPYTRPLIDSLERAQRTNTIGAFKGFEAVGSPVATVAYSRAAVREDVDSSKNIVSVMDRLTDRLDQPFVTVNTVTGDTGIKKAQDEYEQLMRNKTPKSRRV